VTNEAYDEHSPRGDLRRIKAEWNARANEQTIDWLKDYLEREDPAPGQRPDTLLGDKLGLKKRSGRGMRSFIGRTVRHYPSHHGMICEASVPCPGMPAAPLARACARAEHESLDQMLGHQPPAGFIISASADGELVRVRAFVSDKTAMLKLAKGVYSTFVVQFDESDRLHRLSLYDMDKVEKGVSGGLICKVYEREGEAMSEWKAAKAALKRAGIKPGTVVTAVEQAVRKSSAPRLPASAEAAFAEVERTEKALASGTCGDRLAASAQNQRARQQVGVEFIKVARQLGNRLYGAKFG